MLAVVWEQFLSLTLQVALPYILVITSFASFLVWNGGVVLGDKANHVASLHFPQLGYYVLYASALLWPHVIESPAALAKSLVAAVTSIRSASLLAGLLALSTALVHSFT